MPNWVSKDGIWSPAKERQWIPEDPEKGRAEGFLYEGPDRAATAELHDQNVEFLGMLNREDPEVISRARNMGMTVEEFLKLNEPQTKAAQAAAADAQKQTVTHSLPKPNKAVSHKLASLPMEGGFGDPPADARTAGR